MNINNLAKAITTELEQYSQEIANNLKKDTEIIAKECAEELKLTSPQSSKGGSQTYSKGWTFKKAYESNLTFKLFKDVHIEQLQTRKAIFFGPYVGIWGLEICPLST